MAVILTEAALIEAPPVAPRRKKWTREEVDFLSTTELFAGTHYELIEGELIDKMAKNRPHINAAQRVLRALEAVFDPDYVVPEPAIRVAAADDSTSAPEPDIVVLKAPFDVEEERLPTPADIALVVEVSDSTLSFDLGVKANLYARAGIADYWVFDLVGRRLIAHREPSEGRYRSVIAYDESESLAPLAAPESPFFVAAAFPKPSPEPRAA